VGSSSYVNFGGGGGTSPGNEVYNDTISKGVPGIVLANGSFGNKIYNNTLLTSTDGISITSGAHGNSLYSNTIISATRQGIMFDNNTVSKNNRFYNNRVTNSFIITGK